MFRIAAIVIGLALLLCACETTATGRYSSGTEESGSQSVTVGGEMTLRGQHLGSD